MDIAITGSSGLIGTALTRSLEGDGHRVVPVVRGDGRPGAVRWDPTGATIDAAGLEGVDAVVHLAGEGGLRPVDHGAAPPHRREPPSGDHPAGPHPGRARSPARRARQRQRHRLLRRAATPGWSRAMPRATTSWPACASPGRRPRRRPRTPASAPPTCGRASSSTARAAPSPSSSPSSAWASAARRATAASGCRGSRSTTRSAPSGSPSRPPAYGARSTSPRRTR
ncbi:MAG: NAD-dependent epimerase/dehydratase family protein [Acidimicrobiales bacterium]